MLTDLLQRHLESVPVIDPIIQEEVIGNKTIIDIRTVRDQTLRTTNAYFWFRKPVCTIDYLERHPLQAGKGFGRRFYGAIEAFCKEIGITEIKMLVFENRWAYWKSVGFTQTETGFFKQI